MKLKRGDIYLISILLAVAVIMFLFINFKSNISKDAKVYVTVNREVYGIYDLSEDMSVVIETEYGQNTLTIKDNTAYVSDADCPDKTCVLQGFISKSNESIICLPHKLVVEIKFGEDSDLDAVVN